MGDVEEPQFNSLSERIAALKKQQVCDQQHGSAARPLVESRSKSINNPSIQSFGSSVTRQSNNEPIGVRSPLPPPVTKYTKAEPRPPLPQRTPSQSPSLSSTNGTAKPSPALPPRRASQQQLVRRESNESLASMTSTVSSISTLSLGPSFPSRRPSSDTGRLRGLPPPLHEANLPPLPPSRRESKEKELQAKSAKFSSIKNDGNSPRSYANPRPPPVVVKSMPQIPTSKRAPPSLPPRSPSMRPQMPQRPTASSNRLEEERSPGLPPRPNTSSNKLEAERSPGLPPRPKTANTPAAQSKEQNARKLPPLPAQRSALSWAMNKTTPREETQLATRPSDTPPAIPRASRPSNFEIEQILKVEASPTPADNCCMKCRDFSAPDQLAAQYPRESIPNLSTQYLADVLCRPFSSHTDKARAIFTWLHHNIAYDTVAFFGGNVQHATPETTLNRGLAVCGGYAGLFTSIATKAGLESMVVSGHGKGIGYTPLKAGEKIPPYSAGHAWNAVRIDGGEWKLIDSCWGSGHITCGTQNYNKSFNPFEFTKSNEEFGLSHFPGNDSCFFRNDGRVMTWEEYYVGPGPIGMEKLQIFGRPAKDHGIDPESFLPYGKIIDVSRAGNGEVSRFQFSKVCPHWDHERHGGMGKPYLLGLFINGVDGRGFNRGRGQEKNDFVPFETDGFFSWVDLETRVLGAAGQKVKLAAVTTLGERDGRGVTIREYKQAKGMVGMSWSFVAEWDLV